MRLVFDTREQLLKKQINCLKEVLTYADMVTLRPSKDEHGNEQVEVEIQIFQQYMSMKAGDDAARIVGDDK